MSLTPTLLRSPKVLEQRPCQGSGNPPIGRTGAESTGRGRGPAGSRRRDDRGPRQMTVGCQADGRGSPAGVGPAQPPPGVLPVRLLHLDASGWNWAYSSGAISSPVL